MITDWIQAICAVLSVCLTAVGFFCTLPKISKGINENVNATTTKIEDQWKRLIELYAHNPTLNNYSNLGDKNETIRKEA